MSHILTMQDFAIMSIKKIMELYLDPMYKKIKNNPNILSSFSGFLLNPEKIIFYVGKTHLAIEYVGPEKITSIEPDSQFEIKIFDYSQSDENFLDKIIRFKMV
ncbi:protein of unknown function [Tepidibacter aestuarii]|nr:protein of unknown function [Tepidibacter aestuarii]